MIVLYKALETHTKTDFCRYNMSHPTMFDRSYSVINNV